MISFRVDWTPVGQPRQRHRVVHSSGQAFAMNYTRRDDPVQAFKAAVRLAAKLAYQGPPLEGPVWLSLVFLMPRPQRLMWKTREMPRIPCVSKPDLDNFYKSAADALSGIVFVDDAQVAQAELGKFFASGRESPGVEVVLRRLEGCG